MSSKMTLLGVGPMIALSTAPYLALVVAVMLWRPDLLRMQCVPATAYLIAGALGVCFFAMYGSAARMLLKELPKGLLVTRGPFALSRHPLYSAFAFFGLPALAFALRSWVLLSVAPVMGLITSHLVRREEAMLEETFGEAYRAYEKAVSRMLPLPRIHSRLGQAVVVTAALGSAVLVLYLSALEPWLGLGR